MLLAETALVISARGSHSTCRARIRISRRIKAAECEELLGEFKARLATFSQQRVRGVLVGISTLYPRRTEQLVALATRHALPAIYQFHEYALAGGLISYGVSIHYSYHLVGIYAGRILKGEKPGDLPVERAVKIKLIINLKTAKALGLTVPETLLATADEVIQ
jgi:putative ABC transport system substrate-binding protein